MKRIFLFSAFVVYCSSLFISCNSGWEPLLGTNLSEADYNPEVWSIDKEGVISATKDESIWTKQQYENFELSVDYKNDIGTNSGVIVYCTDKKNWIPNAVEIQIADDFKDGVRREASTGSNASVYGHLAPTKSNVNPAGEWNTMIIRCEGQQITVTNNGEKVTEMDMRKWTSGTHNPDGSEIPSWLPKPYAGLPTKGFIGFQGKHGQSNIYFRNIKIRNLK